MKKRLLTFKVFLLILVLSTIAITPFFFMGISEGGKRWQDYKDPYNESDLGATYKTLSVPETHDMRVHFDQMRSFYTGLSAGVLYPRWQEDTNRGFGAPTMNYYPPGIYYITSLCYWLTKNWNLTLYLALLLITLASGLVFYLYARRVLTRFPSLLATSLYIFAPYRLTDQYQRGAIAELLTFVWLPLILFFIDRLLFNKKTHVAVNKIENELGSTSFRIMPLQSDELWNIAGLTASYGASLWSHAPTAYQLTLTFIILLPLLAYFRKNLRGFVLAGFSMVLGAGLSAAYLFPAAIEQNYIRSYLANGDTPYEQSYLLTQINLPPGASHDFFSLLNYEWLLNMLLLVMITCVLVFYHQGIKEFEDLKSRQYAWLFVGFFSSFMMLPAADVFRGIIPKLKIGIYSWRFLTISSFIAALLFGSLMQMVYIAWKAKPEKQRLILAVGSFSLLCLVGFSITKVILPMRSFQIFEPRKEHLNYTMIPNDVTLSALELPIIQRAGFTKQPSEIIFEKWFPQSRKMKVSLQQDDRLIVRTFNFPGWIARVDGKMAVTGSYPELGAIELPLAAGTHSIELEFVDTPPRQLGNLITIVSFMLLLAVLTIAGLRARSHSPIPDQTDVKVSGISVKLAN